MSKKESEFDRYERVKKFEREAEAEKRKFLSDIKKRNKKQKADAPVSNSKNWARDYDLEIDDLY